MRKYCNLAQKYLVRIIDFENRFRRISTELAKLLYFHFQGQNKRFQDKYPKWPRSDKMTDNTLIDMPGKLIYATQVYIYDMYWENIPG